MAQTAKVRGLGQRSAFVACFTDDSQHISVPCFVLLCVSVGVCVCQCVPGVFYIVREEERGCRGQQCGRFVDGPLHCAL